MSLYAGRPVFVTQVSFCDTSVILWHKCHFVDVWFCDSCCKSSVILWHKCHFVQLSLCDTSVNLWQVGLPYVVLGHKCQFVTSGTTICRFGTQVSICNTSVTLWHKCHFVDVWFCDSCNYTYNTIFDERLMIFLWTWIVTLTNIGVVDRLSVKHIIGLIGTTDHR